MKDKKIVYMICDDKQIKMTRDTFDYLMTIKHYNKKLKEYITNLQEENKEQRNIIVKQNDELKKQVEEKDKEIERLNNIINELEKWLNDSENSLIHYDYESKYEYIYVDEFLNKLKELKEGK